MEAFNCNECKVGTHGVMEAVVMRHHLQKKKIQNLNGQFLNIIELVQ
jgi:hypothetical protein